MTTNPETPATGTGKSDVYTSETGPTPKSPPMCRFPGCQRPAMARSGDSGGRPPAYCDDTEHTALKAHRARQAAAAKAGRAVEPDMDRPAYTAREKQRAAEATFAQLLTQLAAAVEVWREQAEALADPTTVEAEIEAMATETVSKQADAEERADRASADALASDAKAREAREETERVKAEAKAQVERAEKHADAQIKAAERRADEQIKAADAKAAKVIEDAEAKTREARQEAQQARDTATAATATATAQKQLAEQLQQALDAERQTRRQEAERAAEALHAAQAEATSRIETAERARQAAEEREAKAQERAERLSARVDQLTERITQLADAAGTSTSKEVRGR